MPTCEACESEIIDGLGCECGDYESGFDKAAYFAGAVRCLIAGLSFGLLLRMSVLALEVL